MFDIQSDPLLIPFLEWIYTSIQQMPCQVLGPVPGTQLYEGDSGPAPSPPRRSRVHKARHHLRVSVQSQLPLDKFLPAFFLGCNNLGSLICMLVEHQI